MAQLDHSLLWQQAVELCRLQRRQSIALPLLSLQPYEHGTCEGTKRVSHETENTNRVSRETANTNRVSRETENTNCVSRETENTNRVRANTWSLISLSMEIT